jgi:hypothetical protein
VTVCGLWLAHRRLVAVLVGERGEVRRSIRAALTDEARFGLVEYLTHSGCEIVASEALARADLVAAQADRRGLAAWRADDALVGALLAAAAVRDPMRAAALLAWLRLLPAWRGQRRRLAPASDARQLPLI